MQRLVRILTLCLAAAVVVSACGSRSQQGATASTRAAPAVHKTVNPADAISVNMVSAVPLNKNLGVPVEVRFEVKDHPQVAQPVAVDLVIVPLSASVDRVAGKIQTDDGLDLLDGEQIPASDRPPEGVPIRHSVRVQPKKDGLYTFSAVVSVDSAGQTYTQTFSVPLIAGSGMPDLPEPALKTPARAAATAPASTAALTATKPGGAAATQ